jgi:ribosomal peptide maturation radical SAM protein 1
MAFRSKSGPRAVEEMEAQVKKYGIRQIQVVDNILDMQYFKTVVPYLIERPIADLYYETKANLTKAQVKLLAQSGIRWIQPGIESLSDSTLQLMNKGVTELQNIQLLKWSMELGVSVDWNFLYGFPGEREEELKQVASHAETLHHLEPPVSAIVLNLDRFSPYFKAPEKYGLEPVYPAKPYRYVYPFPEDSLRRLAYFYDSDFFKGKADSDGFKVLKGVVERWGKAHPRSHLLAIPRKKSMVVLDTRPCARRFLYRLTGLRRRVYEYCDKAAALNTILESVGPSFSADDVQSALQSLVDDKLMLGVNGRYLSLATVQVDNHKRLFTKNRPMGSFRHTTASDYARRLAHLGDVRAAVNLVVRTVVKTSMATTTKLRWKMLFLLVKAFSQPRMDEGSLAS